MKRALALAIAMALASSPMPAAASSSLARGDAAWARRAEGQQGARARPDAVREAIAAYEAAVAETPANLEPHWKLLRALWFEGAFASANDAQERALYERARVLAEPLMARLNVRLGNPSPEAAAARPDALRAKLPAAELHDAAQLYFWAAVGLGAWSRSAGLLEAVRAGAARRLHGYTQLSIALDPSVEGGGALRLLSRLHAELPRVPLLSGFVDRERALPLAVRAAQEYPEHPGNLFLVGLTLLDLTPDRRDEALRLMQQAAQLEPRREQLVEDTAVQRSARVRLQAEGRGARTEQEAADAHADSRDRSA